MPGLTHDSSVSPRPPTDLPVEPRSLGVSHRRALGAVGLWSAGVLLTVVVSGVGTEFRLPVVTSASGAVVALLGVLTITLMLRRAVNWFRLVVVATVVAVGVAVQLIAVVSSPSVLVQQSSSGDELRASLEVPKMLFVFDNLDGLAVRVERPGLVTEDLGTFCLWGTSGPPHKAHIRWKDSRSFIVTTGPGYGYGPYEFHLEASQARPVDPAWERC